MPQRILKTYYEALEEGKIMATKCSGCGCIEWPPVPACNNCGSIDMTWIEVKGEAIVDDIQPANLNMTFGPVKKYWPYYFFVGRLVEGTDIGGILLGVTEENEAEIRAKLPLRVKAAFLQHDGFKSVAWRINE